MSDSDKKETNKKEINELNSSIKNFNDFSQDQIGLKVFGADLANTIKRHFKSFEEEPFNISLHAKFGYGKTTFLKMWKNYLKQEGFKVININAWENDFYKNPALSFVYSFLDGLQKESVGISKEGENAIIHFMGSLISQTGEHFFGINLNKTLEDVREGSNAKDSKLFQELQKIQKIFQALKESLKSIKTDKLPIIVLVDELDRCRPDHAVDILEIMKHFFSNPNIVFVCALNKDQIKSTAINMFGNDLEFEGYYKKFFKYDTELPSIKGKLEVFFKSKLEKFNYNQNEHEKIEGRVHFGDYVLSTLEFSLRDVDQFMVSFDRFFEDQTKKTIPYILIDLVILATALYLKKPTPYQDFIKEKINIRGFLFALKEELGFFEQIDIHLETMRNRHILSFFYQDYESDDVVRSFLGKFTNLSGEDIKKFIESTVKSEYERFPISILRKKKGSALKRTIEVISKKGKLSDL